MTTITLLALSILAHHSPFALPLLIAAAVAAIVTTRPCDLMRR